MSNLFREKNLERISSPEQLNSYIRVSTPSVWLLLAAIVILLVGVCIWGVFGYIHTTIPVLAVAEGHTATAYVRETDVHKVADGTAVSMNGIEGHVLSVSSEPVYVKEDTFTEYMRHVGQLQPGDWVYKLALDLDCADGIYTAQIVIDSISPMSFVIN